MGRVFSKLSFLTSSYCEEREEEATDNYLSDINPENQRWEADSTSAYSKPLWTSELCHTESLECIKSEAEAEVFIVDVDSDEDTLGIKYLFCEEEPPDPEVELEGLAEMFVECQEDENLNIYKVFYCICLFCYGFCKTHYISFVFGYQLYKIGGFVIKNIQVHTIPTV